MLTSVVPYRQLRTVTSDEAGMGVIKMADSRCTGCKYNVPKKLGGRGIICNGITMSTHGRCPEWVINDYLKTHKGNWTREDVLESNRL